VVEHLYVLLLTSRADFPLIKSLSIPVSLRMNKKNPKEPSVQSQTGPSDSTTILRNVPSNGLTTPNKSNSIPASKRMNNTNPNEPSAQFQTGSSGSSASAATEMPKDTRLEYGCKHGTDCHGICGACAYNHTLVPFGKDVCVTFGQISGDGLGKICRNDKPWDGVRCELPVCGFEHFWGYVGLRIARQNQQKQAAKKQPPADATTAGAKPDAKKQPHADATTAGAKPVAKKQPHADATTAGAKPVAKKQPHADATTAGAKPVAKKQKPESVLTIEDFKYKDALAVAEDFFVDECIDQHRNLDAVNDDLTTKPGYSWLQVLTFEEDVFNVNAGVKTWSFSRARFFGNSSFQNKLRAKMKVSIPDAWIRIDLALEDGKNVFFVKGEKLRVMPVDKN
jgi:hypothetical protein